MGSCVSSENRTCVSVLKDLATSLKRILSRLTCRPVMVTQDQFAAMLDHPSCYWVYARLSRLSDQNNFANQFLYALDIKEKKYVPLPNPPMNFLVDNASAVLDNNLYLMGGQTAPYVHNLVHVFQPVLHGWSDTNINMVLSRSALAASVDGKVYVFGGSDVQIDRWAEVYDPTTKAWTAIPSSEDLIRALSQGLDSLRTSAVLGNKIILRGSRNGNIAFDLLSSSWITVSDKLIEGWWKCVRAAVVQNLLITCHSEYDQHQIPQLSIRAYDPDEDVWLQIEGIDRSFHKEAERSHFLSVNGKLVIYCMSKKNDLKYSTFEIKERCRASVRAKLLWQSTFPVAMLIKKGNYLAQSGNIHSTERSHKGIYVQSVLEAVRADGLKESMKVRYM